MMTGATGGQGGGRLGNHLAATAGMGAGAAPGASRGLVSDTTRGRIAELTKIASRGRTAKPLYHVFARPPEGSAWTEQDFARFWEGFEQEFGMQAQPFAEAAHDGGGHHHRVYSLVRRDGTTIRMSNDYARREKLERVAEFDSGEAFTKGAHNRAVVQALEVERPDVAAAMLAAGLHKGLRPVAGLTPGARAQQERTNVSKAGVAQAVAAAWAASDSGPAFAAALAEHGLVLARGDKRGGVPVVVDRTGNTHAVLRMLSMAAKAGGTHATPAADIAARLDGMALPSVANARQAIAVQAPAPPPDDGPPSPDVLTPLGGGQAAPGSEDAPHAHVPAPSVHGGGAPVHAAAQAAPGASLDDAGPGPGEPPGPGAHPDELARYRAALAAYQDRKASAWARWMAQQNARPSTPLSGGSGHAGQAEIHGGQRHSRAIAAQAVAWIRAAQASGTGDSREAVPAGPSADAAADRNEHPGSRDDASIRNDHPGDARADGPGVEPAARPDDAQPVRSAEPDTGLDRGRAGDSGKPEAAGSHARTALRHAAATRHLEGALASMPAAMDALRRASMELSPAWRAGRDAQARIVQDRARIAATLAAHPHPDPASRDPAARANAYAHAISERTRQRAAAADAAQAQAAEAMQGRSRTTRALALIGIRTAAQHQAETMAAHARTLADAAGDLPSREDYRHARADGEAHAYAAQQTVTAWEARPLVAAAMEQHRLNQAAQQAIDAGDQAIGEAVAAGDPEAARAIIHAREAVQDRQAAAAARLADLARGLHGQDDTMPPAPGRS